MDCPRYSNSQFCNFSTIINRKYKCNFNINKPNFAFAINIDVSVNRERYRVTGGLLCYSILVNLLSKVNKTFCKIVWKWIEIDKDQVCIQTAATLKYICNQLIDKPDKTCDKGYKNSWQVDISMRLMLLGMQNMFILSIHIMTKIQYFYIITSYDFDILSYIIRIELSYCYEFVIWYNC